MRRSGPSASSCLTRHHHERHDGSGYPDGLRGDQIPITAAILQLADVFDALTTDRPYRAASTPAEALKIMDEEALRGWWDRNLFEHFSEMIGNGDSQLAPAKSGESST